ncbi:MAG: hypothetical protein M3P43_17105 [Actinomycetota bacterium]|nr:hypothetical protein [Actinomycetota bacterium]
MPRRRALLPLALVFSIVAMSACSSKSSTQAPPAVGQAFAARATAVCQSALEAKQGWSAFPVPDFDPTHPDPSAFPEVAVWLEDQVAPTFEAWLDGLRALGSPPTGRQAWSEVLAAIERIVQGNADQVAAAKAGDTEAFVAATDDLKATQIELERATAAAGTTKCAEVHKA